MCLCGLRVKHWRLEDPRGDFSNFENSSVTLKKTQRFLLLLLFFDF